MLYYERLDSQRILPLAPILQSYDNFQILPMADALGRTYTAKQSKGDWAVIHGRHNS